MGWLRNNNIILHPIVQRYYSEASMRVTQIRLYRSRTTIDSNIFRYMNMVFNYLT